MKIAIIGAGFCGLAMAWHMSREGGCEVTLFDDKGVGGGASGVAAGLMHPYPGKQARRSWRATEGLAATGCLLEEVERQLGRSVADRSGILRRISTEEERRVFAEHADAFGDVERIDDQLVCITSGVTVFAPLYLEGLWSLCARNGCQWIKRRVHSLQEVASFDRIILAMGAELLQLAAYSEPIPGIALGITKGQILLCRPSSALPVEKSWIAQGYLVPVAAAGHYVLGATYERQFVDALPDLQRAEELILPKLRQAFPQIDALQRIGCRAGLRIFRRGHATPWVGQCGEATWCLTAMGSRGLLYHALLAEELANTVLCKG